MTISTTKYRDINDKPRKDHITILCGVSVLNFFDAENNMFKGLDEIDWSSLASHNAGTKIPQQLRRLASGTPEERSVALHGIRNAIYHQGDVGKVTAYVVPFLNRIVLQPTLSERADILNLIAGTMTSWDRIRKIKDASEEAAYAANFSIEWFQTQKSYARDVYQAVRRDFNIFVTLLGDAQSSTRDETVHILSYIVEDAIVTIPLILNNIKNETILRSRAIKMWYLSNLLAKVINIHNINQYLEFKSDFLKLCESVLNNESDFLLRFSAAISITNIAKRASSEQTLQEIISAATEFNEFELPWGETVVTSTSAALCKLGRPAGQQALIKILKQVVDVQDAQIFGAALLALTMKGETEFNYWHNFGSIGVGFDANKRETRKYDGEIDIQPVNILTQEYRETINALVQCDRFWEIDSNLLSLYGFINSREELRKLLTQPIQ